MTTTPTPAEDIELEDGPITGTPQERLEQMRQRNMKLEQALARAGRTLTPEWAMATHLRIVINLLYPEGTDERAEFDIQFQEALTVAFTEGLRQARTEQIVQNNGAPGLFLPGRPG